VPARRNIFTLGRGVLCWEETEQAQEWEGVWEEEGIVLAPDPEAIVFALLAEQRFLIRQARLALQ